MQKKWGKYMAKRVAAMTLAAAMAVSLAGCGGGNPGSPGGSASGTGGTAAQAGAAPAEAPAASSEAPKADSSRKTTADSDERYGKVTVALSSDPQDLAPYTWAGDHSKQYIYYNIYEALFDFRGGGYIPILAKEYQDVDETHTRVTLHDNIYDAAGNHITAQDVVFSTGLLVDSGNAVKYDIFDSVKAIDDYTLEYTWTGPVVQVGALEWPWCCTMVVSQKSYEEIGGFADKPIGTGPYVVSEYVSGAHLTLKANDKYWQTAELRDSNHKANVETIEYDIIAEASQHVIALSTDQIQYSQAVPAENLKDFSEGGQYADRYGVYVTQGSELYTLIPNCSENNLMSDVNLRKAIFYALDNQAIAAATGTSIAARAFGTPFFEDYYPAWESTETYMNTYDLQKAKEYLEQSGYNGETLRLEGFNREDIKSIMTMIQALLLQAGINVEINAKESALVQSDVNNPDAWDILLWNPGGGTQVGEWNRPINYNEFGTGFNMAFLHDDELQELFMTANTVDGHNEENMTRVHDYIVENAYYHALCMPQMNAVYSKDFATLVYRESEFLLPGACDYYLD